MGVVVICGADGRLTSFTGTTPASSFPADKKGLEDIRHQNNNGQISQMVSELQGVTLCAPAITYLLIRRWL